MRRVGLALAAGVPAVLGGGTLGTYAVDYPANRNFLCIRDGAAHIGWMAEHCPATLVVLGGFSQGASMLAGAPPGWFDAAARSNSLETWTAPGAVDVAHIGDECGRSTEFSFGCSTWQDQGNSGKLQ